MPSMLSSLLQMRGENEENMPDLMAEESGMKTKDDGITGLCKLLIDLIMLKKLYRIWTDEDTDDDSIS